MSHPTEQDTWRSWIGQRLDKQDDLLEKNLAQSTKTNGRVSQLEIDREIGKAQMRIMTRLLYAVGTGLAFLIGQVVIPLVNAWHH